MEKDFLSDYNIKETIGQGTFSIVKLGINKTTKEKVAIKILKKKKLLQNSDKSRLEREISILKKLNHINVIKTHKINEDFDKYYIVMEYCENGELFNYIVDRQKLNEEEASYFFYQLINGLDYIHHKNIVHRDLKPENLLLGKGNILKIVDFGLSNYYEEEKLLSTPCGSPCYASPEMVCGNKYDGLMIDIWSCGIIIYAMTCGYLPFEDINNEILFKKIMKCKIDYPEFLSNNTLDIMKKILVVDPNKRINIQEIRKHPFYLKGKNIFEFKHKNLVFQVEKNIDNNEDENKNEEFDYNFINKINENIPINIKKSKSTNFIDNENDDINRNKNDNYKLYKNKVNKFFIERNIMSKECATNRKNSEKKDINNKSYGLISKKYHIRINSKDKEINNIVYTNNNKIEEPKNNSVKKDTLNLIDKKENIYSHKDTFDSNIINNLSTENLPLSNDFNQKNLDNIPNLIEEYQNINKKNNVFSHGKAKINLSLLQQLLKKEKTSKNYKEKNYFILSKDGKNDKEKENISYILPPPKKHKTKEKLQNINSKTEYINKIKSLNYEKIDKIEQNNDENINYTNRSDKSNNKSILSYNNIKKNNNKEYEYGSKKISENKLKIETKHHNNLDLIKYGISNKDINELFKNNKNINKIYESNTTKNKQIGNYFENISNNENNNNNINNIHIKNLRILNNNNYNNIKNITNINNVKSINNIIICNSPLKSLIKDVQYLTKINNNDLPNINKNIHKEIKIMNNNNFNDIMNTNNNIGNITNPSGNNVLIPKILVSKDINNSGIYNNYNTSNLNKIYLSSLNKKLKSINKNINKKNNVNNLMNNYKNSASSIDYLNKKTLSKKQISERNINSYGFDFMSLEYENNSISKKNNIVYTTKNKMNLNKIKNNKVDIFTYGRNNENLVTLKKIKYNNNNFNFNTAKNNGRKIFSTKNLINK